METDRLMRLLLFMFIISMAATIFLAYAVFVALPRQHVIAQTGGCGVIYTVQRGDTLSGIAVRCGVPLNELQALNPSITDQNIAPGQVLTIPQAAAQPTQLAPTEGILPEVEPTLEFQPTSGQVGGGIPGQDDQAGGGSPGMPTAQPPAAGTPVPQNNPQRQQDQSGGVPFEGEAGGQRLTYTVQPGDTLSGIAASYGVSLQAVIDANPQIDNPNLIFPGQTINIPGTVPPTGGKDYIVQAEDTLSAIAARFGVALNQLVDANPQISNPNLIYPGQPIAIPGGSIPSTGGSIHIVQLGNTLSQIARLYGATVTQLLALNPDIIDPDLIYPGQVIQLP